MSKPHVDDADASDPTAWLLPSGARAQKSEMNHLQETSFPQQQDSRYRTARRHAARAIGLPDTGQKTGPIVVSSFHEQIDGGTRYFAPIYDLQDKSKILEETTANVDSRGFCTVKSSLTRIKASTNWNRSPASPPRQKPPVPRRPNQLHSALPSHTNKTSAASLIPSAVRNKSTECNVIRPNVMKGEADQSRRGVRPSHTTSATATRCATSAPRRPPPPHTNRHLQRKIHSGKTSETESPMKKVQTYSVKKPLPYTAGRATLRRQTSAAKNLPESSYMSQSSESLVTQISDPRRHQDDADDDHDADYPLKSDKRIPGSVNKIRSRPAALPRTPTPKPSLEDVRMEHSLQRPPRANVTDDVVFRHSQQPYSQLPKARKGKRNEMQTDRQTGGKLRSHSSHSVSSRYNSHYCTVDNQQQQQQQLEEQYQLTSDLISSTSQQSVISYLPQHKKTRMPRQPASTDAGNFARKPVPVAPSGPAGNRRASKIPRPQVGARPSVSVTSTTSKCSSVTSLRSEFNYARPMPIERIPYSKFGLECIVPLARLEVSVTPMEAFCITGVTGQRKRFLPLIEITGKGLWDRVNSTEAPLLVVTAQHDAAEDECSVSIISSLVSRSVSHAATQTQKSVSMSTASSRATASRPPRKKNGSSRKEKVVDQQDENNEDYSGMLVRLVQLLYLQTKLNASKADKNNSAGNEAVKSANQPAITTQPNATQSTLLHYLQQHQLQQQKHRFTAPHGTAQTNPRPYTLNQGAGARVYRMGSSVTQVYSKDYHGGQADVESANNWSNATKSSTIYFDNAQQPETKPWSSYRSPRTASFKPNFSQWRHSDNRGHASISSYPGMRHGYSGYRTTAEY